LAVFVVTILLMGLDFYTAVIICTTIAMIIIDMFGAMYLFNIELNAVSLVNLVMVNANLTDFIILLFEVFLFEII
jgi:Niemann-Pick C1 protein